MRNIVNTLVVLLAAVVALSSCVEEPMMSFQEVEQRSLRAWIEKYHPELRDNYQEEGGYYVEVLDYGVQDSVAITGSDVWVWYDFTNRDLQGNVCETRDWLMAYQLGTYTDHTHYNPTFRFSGANSHTLMEGTYLATFNKLKIRNAESGQIEEMDVRYGTRLRLYLPSSVSASTTIDGGYEGQFTMDENKPLIVEMTLYGHISNPVAYEGERVDAFAERNGGVCEEHKAKDEDDSSEEARRRRGVTRAEEDDSESDEEVDTRPLEFFDGRWHQPVDTLEHLYVNYAYSPETVAFDFATTDRDLYPNENRYNAGTVYSTLDGVSQLSDLDRRINEALVERFGRGITRDEVLEADSLKVNPTAKLWYVGRFLDGYIFDTNIDEVKEIVFGKVENPGTALDFDTRNPKDNSYILAWNYAIPTLRYGQWATILTVSTYAYGIKGQVGSHTSTTTGTNDAYYDAMNYYNYMNYMNSYYGYGYGNMYNSGYYGYNPYYYGYTYDTNNSTTTVTTTSTEIQSYTPLIFQVFVEE